MDIVTQKVIFVYRDLEDQIAYEGIWCDKEGEYYRIKNIPFYAPNIAYDDLISVEVDDNELFFEDLIQESGNSTIQLIFFEDEFEKKILNDIIELNCSWEGSNNPRYFSINVPKDVNYKPVKEMLEKWLEKKVLDYKESCMVHNY